MNMLNKYLTEEEFDYSPSNQRQIYMEIADGLTKEGPAVTPAVNALNRYISDTGQEPTFSEPAEGAPPKNLANDIRNQEVIPSKDAQDTYKNLFGIELPGTGDLSPTEIRIQDLTMAAQASGFERGFPPDNPTKFAISALNGQEPNKPNAREDMADSMQEIQANLFGPSKAAAGILQGDKEKYVEGMLECIKIGKACNTLEDQMTGHLKKGLEQLLGKDNIQQLKEGISELKPIEDKVASITNAILEPTRGPIKDLTDSFKDMTEGGRNLITKKREGIFGGEVTESKTSREIAGDSFELLQNVGKTVNNAVLLFPKIALGVVDKVINGDKNQEKTGAIEGQGITLKTPLKDIDLRDIDLRTPIKDIGKNQENSLENPTPYPVEPEQPEDNNSALTKIITGSVAYHSERKKGVLPNKAGKTARQVEDATEEITQGMDQAGEKNGKEKSPLEQGASKIMDATKNMAGHAITKVLGSVATPVGPVLVIAAQLANVVVQNLTDDKKPKEGKEGQDKNSPLGALASSIPGDLNNTGQDGPSPSFKENLKKALKKTIDQAIPNGLSGAIGDGIGQATVGVASGLTNSHNAKAPKEAAGVDDLDRQR